MPSQELASQKKIQQSVLNSIRQKPGFILIEGEPGSGKTFVKNQLIKQLRSQVLIVDITYSRYSFDEFVSSLAEKLKLKCNLEDAKDCLNALHQFCQSKLRSGTPLAVIIDDAQFMPVKTFELLKQAINGENDAGSVQNQLGLYGVLFSDNTLKPTLDLEFITDGLIHTCLTLPRPSEADMRQFLQQLIANNNPTLSLSEGAELVILINSAGNLRKAKLLLQRAAEQCQQSSQLMISEEMVENLSTAETVIPILDQVSRTNQSAIPDALQGILTRSLLDTPEKPVLKTKHNNNDMPLFANDLANTEASSFSQPLPTGNLELGANKDKSQAITTPSTPQQSAPINPQTVNIKANEERTPEQVKQPNVENTENSNASSSNNEQPTNERTNDNKNATEIKTTNDSALTASKATSSLSTEDLESKPEFVDSFSASPIATDRSPIAKTQTKVKSSPGISRWILIIIFAGLLGGLAWLSTQPGFDPTAKIEKLKALIIHNVQQYLPALQDIAPPSNTPIDLPTNEDQKQPLEALPTETQEDAPVNTQKTTVNKPQTEAKKPTDKVTIIQAEQDLINTVEAQLESAEEENLDTLINDELHKLQTQKPDQAPPKEAPATTNVTPDKIDELTDKEKTEAIEDNAPPNIDDLIELEARDAQLTMLSKKAKIHLDNYRYTIPESDNAVLTLRRILDIDAENTWASEQLTWIKEQYMRRAQTAKEQGNNLAAAQILGRLLWIDSSNAEAKAAIRQIQQ